MKLSIKSILFVLLTQTASAQYYYKDIIATKEAIAKDKLYKENKVRSVELSSKDANNQPEEGFECNQKIANNYSEIDTYSKSKFTPESFQTSSYAENGLLRKTIDTSKAFYSVTDYTFDDAGRLINIRNTSTETDNQSKDVEEHQWQYDQKGRPVEMIKIKNGTDTTLIHFIVDEKGNVAEERASHSHVAMQSIFYYYDDDNRLTDIVRFNEAAGRLLPDYVFSYDPTGLLSSMIVVPEGSSDYQRWIYQYNDQRLRVKETCLNKQHQTLGSIFYQYNYSK
jgi:hypothetical protein